MVLERSLLTDQCRRALMRWAMTPRQRAVRFDDLAARLQVSRTPVREAVQALETIGLVKSAPYRGVTPLFTGQDELRHRVLILAAAADAGFPPSGATPRERVGRVVGGDWGAVTWDLIAAWPDLSPAWGVDLRPVQARILDQTLRVGAASTSAEVSGALLALHDLY